jgi:hypothetical protein
MQISNNGVGVALTGTAVEHVPALAGQVLQDKLRDVDFADRASGQQIASAKVQDRVVRANDTGRLHFYFRVMEFERDPPDLTVTLVSRGPFWSPPLDVDYRVDGLGEVGPATATWAPSSSELQFSFLPPAEITPEKLSRFVYVRGAATDFVEAGLITLALSTPLMAASAVRTVTAFAPTPPVGMATTAPPAEGMPGTTPPPTGEATAT